MLSHWKCVFFGGLNKWLFEQNYITMHYLFLIEYLDSDRYGGILWKTKWNSSLSVSESMVFRLPDSSGSPEYQYIFSVKNETREVNLNKYWLYATQIFGWCIELKKLSKEWNSSESPRLKIVLGLRLVLLLHLGSMSNIIWDNVSMYPSNYLDKGYLWGGSGWPYRWWARKGHGDQLVGTVTENINSVKKTKSFSRDLTVREKRHVKETGARVGWSLKFSS